MVQGVLGRAKAPTHEGAERDGFDGVEEGRDRQPEGGGKGVMLGKEMQEGEVM